jgi:hypothetical protein
MLGLINEERYLQHIFSSYPIVAGKHSKPLAYVVTPLSATPPGTLQLDLSWSPLVRFLEN